MVCKKCKRPLPEGSKKKLCENCLGKRAQRLKDVGTVALGTVLVALVAIVSKGKNNSKD